MAFKILALLCLVAVACANPTPCHGTDVTVKKSTGGLGGLVGNLVGGVVGLAGNIVGGTLKTAGGLVGGALNAVGGVVDGVLGGGVDVDGRVDLGLNLQGLLRILAGGLTDLAGNAGAILKGLANLRIPGTIDDVFNLVIGLGATIGGVLNALLPGTGVLVGNLIDGLMKILICVLGSPGLTGGILGDRRPGFKNSADIPAICKPKYGVEFGLKGYSGGYDKIDDLIRFFDLDDIDYKLRIIIDDKTDGKGIESFSGSQYWTLKWLLEITSLLKSRRNSNDWSDEDTFTIIVNTTKILGLLGNSYKLHLGKRIVNQIIQYFRAVTKNNKYFKNFDWDDCETRILREISESNQTTFNGAFKKQSESEYSKVKRDDRVYKYNYESKESQSTEETSRSNTETRRQVTENSNSDENSGRVDESNSETRRQVNENSNSDDNSNQVTNERNSQDNSEDNSVVSQETNEARQTGNTVRNSAERNAREEVSEESNSSDHVETAEEREERLQRESRSEESSHFGEVGSGKSGSKYSSSSSSETSLKKSGSSSKSINSSSSTKTSGSQSSGSRQVITGTQFSD